MFLCFIVSNCSICVVIFSIFLGADVSAHAPSCPAEFNITHSLHLYWYSWANKNDDDEYILASTRLQKLLAWQLVKFYFYCRMSIEDGLQLLPKCGQGRCSSHWRWQTIPGLRRCHWERTVARCWAVRRRDNPACQSQTNEVNWCQLIGRTAKTLLNATPKCVLMKTRTGDDNDNREMGHVCRSIECQKMKKKLSASVSFAPSLQK